MKLIIAGDRNFTNYNLLTAKVNKILSNTDINTVEFISGGARGADRLGEIYARRRGKTPKIFNAEWQKYGKMAGPMRNGRMARNATHLIAFLRIGSRGTANMIKQAQENGLKIRIIHI